ncbi:MAG: TlpA family protein disulfide reductase [Spirochaetaceae bacterium]|nr:MAG: TlpA family protein disulfide reductase [Spirochaetaceae bacterium]
MKRTMIAVAVFAVISTITLLVAFGSIGRSSPISPFPTETERSSLDAALQSAGLHPVSGIAPVDFEIDSLEGPSRSLADYRGRIVFLNFWATWCPPCVEEMPSMQRLADILEPEGLAMVAVNVQEDPSLVKQFMNTHGLSFEVLLDRRGQVGQSYAVRGLPTTVILDRTGAIMARKVGFAYWDTDEMIDLFRAILEQV